jgi:hypothetical protein
MNDVVTALDSGATDATVALDGPRHDYEPPSGSLPTAATWGWAAHYFDDDEWEPPPPRVRDLLTNDRTSKETR